MPRQMPPTRTSKVREQAVRPGQSLGLARVLGKIGDTMAGVIGLGVVGPKHLPEDPNHDWRRGHSFDSSAEDPGSYRKTWSYESIGSGPGLRKASSLDSEMLAAFRRLDTVDRTADRNLQSLAVNLDKKFAEADSPDKPKIPTPSTTTPQSSPPSSQTTSPDKEPQETSNKAPGSEKPKVEAKSGPEKEQTEGPKAKQDPGTETQAAATKAESGKAEPEDDEAKLAKKAADLALKKKAAHARYMRYWRSVHGGGLG